MVCLILFQLFQRQSARTTAQRLLPEKWKWMLVLSLEEGLVKRVDFERGNVALRSISTQTRNVKNKFLQGEPI
jgi:hypothetical protein